MPPTNTTAATATVIAALPYALTVDPEDRATTLWWTYTPGAREAAIGVFAGRTSAGAYDPVLERWVHNGTTYEQRLDVVTWPGRPQMLETDGRPIVLAVRDDVFGSSGPTGCSLVLAVVAAPDLATPVGTLCIPPDATVGQTEYPGILVSPTSGDTLRLVHPMEACETGAFLADGTLLVSDKNDTTLLHRYSAALVKVATLSILLSATGQSNAPIATDGTSWYVAQRQASGAITAWQLSATGAVLQTWTLPTLASALRSICYLDGVLYYCRFAAGAPVHAYDLTAESALPDVFAGATGYYVIDVVTPGDGTLLVGLMQLEVGNEVRHLSPSGTLLGTHPFGLGSHESNWFLTHLAVALGVTTSYALCLQNERPADTSVDARRLTYTVVRVADGVALSSVSHIENKQGVGQEVAAGSAPATTSDYFRTPNSCPLLVLPLAIGDDGDDGDGEPGVTYPIRRLRRAPHVNNENKRVFYRSFELDLERGQATATGDGSAPTVLLRFSRDGGQTWGVPVTMPAGAIAAYTQRVLARRLGHARDMVFEVSVTDPIAWSLVGAWLDLEPGQH